MTKVTFSIQKWSVWSAERSDSADWIQWARENTNPATSTKPDISQIPALKRRRMSKLSKMALSTALNCLDGNEQKPICVFASQHGELERTIKIINSFVNNEDTSPTDFSLSVHNTALGLFSIQTHNKMPATTIAAGDDTFGYALLEACNLLQRYPESSVLLVYFDEPLPPPLATLEGDHTEKISISLLISSEKTSMISMNFEFLDKEIQSDYQHIGLEFLKFYLSDEPFKQAQTSRMIWSWKKS